MRRTDPPPRGIVLVLTTGLLTALALAGVLFLQIARTTAGVLATTSASAAARLTTESGLHWGAARMSEGPARFDVPRLAAFRPDDWQYRDGAEYRWVPGAAAEPAPIDIPESENPSFARGEPWTDADGDGRYSAGESWTDLDGDGRCSAWSGRLRGSKTPFGRTFALRIEPGASSRVNVNGGVPAKRWTAATQWDFRGLPSDAENNKLACHLNLLGAALGIRSYEITNTENGAIKPVVVSDLGAEILLRRPSGGFASLDEVGRALVGDGTLARDEWPRLAPHLALHESRNAAGRAWLDVNGAPRAVLASFWMHRAGPATTPYLRYQAAPSDLLIGGNPVFDPWTRKNMGTNAYVFAEEAEGMAGRLLETKRQKGMIEDHRDVYRSIWEALLGPAGHLCPDDGTTPVSESALYATEKGRLLMGLSFPDMVPPGSGYQTGRTISVLSALGSWEWDPDGVPGNEFLPLNFKVQPESGRIIPLHPDGYHGESPYSGLEGFQADRPDRALWTGPIQDFSISCLVRAGEGTTSRLDAEATVFTPVQIDSQEDFENLGTVRTGADPNVGIRRFLPGGIEAKGLSRYDGVQSLPDFSKRSYWKIGMDGFDAQTGALTLAEADPDFPPSPVPTARVEFPPHADGIEIPANNWLDTTRLDGRDHARMKGEFPFADGGPDALFDAGDPFEVQPSQMFSGSTPLEKSDPCWTGNHRTFPFSLESRDGVPAPLRSGPAPCVAPQPHADLARMWETGGIEAWVCQTQGEAWKISSEYHFGPGYLLPQSLKLSRGSTHYTLQWEYHIPVHWEDVNGTGVVDAGNTGDVYWQGDSGNTDNKVSWDLPMRGSPYFRPFPDHVIVEWQLLRYVPNRGNLNALEIRSRLRIVMNGAVVHDAVHTFGPASPEPSPFVPILSRRIAADGRFDSQFEVSAAADQVALYHGFGAGDFRIGNTRPCEDRFVRQGWYESPLFVLPGRARAVWAGWTGLSPQPMRALAPQAVRCWLAGYGDADGASGERSEELEGGGVGGERLTTPALRSFRFRAAFDVPDLDALRDAEAGQGGTGAFIDPPILEDVRIALAAGPRWTHWK